MTKINNEHTKLQIRNWLENAIRKAKSPDPKEKLRRARNERAKKIVKNYGL